MNPLEETTQSISILLAQQNPKAIASTHILVIGASGDVAKKKIYPALFELYHNNFVEGERNLRIHGFARSQLSSTQFRNQIKYGRFHLHLVASIRYTTPFSSYKSHSLSVDRIYDQ